MTMDTRHEPFIRQCYALAKSAGDKGNHPFAAVLAHEGKIILSAENTTITDNDFTRHAEMNLIVQAWRTLPKDVLAQSTVYASTAPCPMCAAALALNGMPEIVYGVSYEAFAAALGARMKHLTADEVYTGMGGTLRFTGPVLEEEGLLVYDHWPVSDAYAPARKGKAERKG